MQDSGAFALVAIKEPSGNVNEYYMPLSVVANIEEAKGALSKFFM